MYSPEVNARITELTYKAAQGQLTQQEAKEAVRILREDRKTAAEAASKKRKQATASVKSAEDLLAELEV